MRWGGPRTRGVAPAGCSPPQKVETHARVDARQDPSPYTLLIFVSTLLYLIHRTISYHGGDHPPYFLSPHYLATTQRPHHTR